MKLPGLIAALALAPMVAFAQPGGAGNSTPVPAAAPAYTMPVEALELAGARAGLGETGASAGGHSFIVRSGTTRMRVFTRTTSRLTNRFRFLTGETETLTGECTLRTEGQSLLGVDLNRTRQAYACTFEGKTADQFAMEVALPAFPETHFGIGGASVSMGGDYNTPETQAILKAKLIYGGVAYDALPTGFARGQPWSRRVVQGYAIARGGQPVGAIAFNTGSNMSNKGTLTTPTNDADGREAVLFMLLCLNGMPDLFADATRQQVLGGN